jgi:hypothetical protein
MANHSEPLTQLPAALVARLQEPGLVLVTTLDADTQWPVNNLITWVMAKDETTVRLAADAKGRVIHNIRANGRVLLTVICDGACLVVEGTGQVIAENLEGVSLKLACAEVKVQAVRDVTFWGGKITQEPAYDVTYDKALKEKLDSSVFAAMKAL